ncbi:MAG: antibiotic biosynthesis monooxygenase [Solirubrobacterales bacterium]|nr:antibiotic biosynthesis monooxygenase [Solirubrobacterales bacterium]
MTAVKINVIQVPDGGGPDLERRFGENISRAVGAPGFLGAELLRPEQGNKYFSVSRWETEDHFRTFAGNADEDVRSGSWRGAAKTLRA